MAKDKWIQSMDLKKGALTETARQHGAITREGTISADFLHNAAAGKYGSVTEKRAELAITLKHLNK